MRQVHLAEAGLRVAIARTRHRTGNIVRNLKHRLVRPTHHFIHIPKNGGTAVRRAFGYKVSLTDPYHYRYIDIADSIGRDLTFFCIVRNPWSRTLSRFLFSKKVAEKWPQSDPRREYILSVSFADYVRDRRIFEIPEHPGMPWMGPMTSWFNQLEWIRDEEGEVASDCLRLERIDDDLAAYFHGKVRLPRTNVTPDSRDYRELYTDELAQIIADVFQDDIEHFGFSFDGPATRNTYLTL